MEQLERISSDRHIDLGKAICASEQAGREALLTKLIGHKLTADESILLKAAAWNLREKEELRTLFAKLRKVPHRQRVEILGHANDDLPADIRNSSNFDRSATRMQTIQRMVVALADEAEIRPLYDPYSVSNTETFIDQETARWDETEQIGLEKKLGAEVRLRPLPPDPTDPAYKNDSLTLLDYLYFMIYTITTTGYGDLTPSTAFARFLVSMANLFELFFIVIIFNAVVTLRSDTAPASKRVGDEDPASSGQQSSHAETANDEAERPSERST